MAGTRATGGAVQPSPAVVALAASLLGWVALAHLGDALQALVQRVLRCYRVTLGPLLIYCALLWGAGLGGGYVLAYHGVGGRRDQAATPAPFGRPSGAALAVTAALLIWLLARALRHGRNAAQPQMRQTARVLTLARRRCAGRWALNVEPWPSALRQCPAAQWRCNTCLAMASPRPVPPLSRERLRSMR